MTVCPSLAHALAGALVDILRFVEGSDEEQMDQDDAVKVMEGVAHLMSGLPGGQREELLRLLAAMAEAETDPGRREFLEGFPEGFGLLDEPV